MYGSTRIQSPMQLPLSTWTHLACTYQAGTVRLDVNGAEVASTTAGALTRGSSGIQIGQSCCDGADELRGDLSDVRFYRRSLTERDVSVLSATSP